MAAFDVSVGRAQSAQFEFFSRESRSNARGVEKKNYSSDFPQTSQGGVAVPREPIARKKRGGHRSRRRAIVRWRRPRIEFVFHSVGGAVAALDLSGRSNSNFVDSRIRSSAAARGRSLCRGRAGARSLCTLTLRACRWRRARLPRGVRMAPLAVRCRRLCFIAWHARTSLNPWVRAWRRM